MQKAINRRQCSTQKRTVRQTPDRQWQSHTENQICSLPDRSRFDQFVLTCARQVSGISTEIFRQIETVENELDAATAAALRLVEQRGEMVVSSLDPRRLSKKAYRIASSFLALQVSSRTCAGGLISAVNPARRFGGMTSAT